MCSKKSKAFIFLHKSIKKNMSKTKIEILLFYNHSTTHHGYRLPSTPCSMHWSLQNNKFSLHNSCCIISLWILYIKEVLIVIFTKQTIRCTCTKQVVYLNVYCKRQFRLSRLNTTDRVTICFYLSTTYI